MQRKYLAFSLSIILVIVVLLLLGFKGLKYGIDFTGGILIEFRSEKETNISSYRKLLSEHQGITIQTFDNDDVVIRIPPSNESQAIQVEQIKELLLSVDPNIILRKIDYVGPKVGSALIKDALLAMFFALLAIVIYLGFRFRWYYGIGAIVALIHDVVMMVGFYVLFDYEFDLTSVAAILLIIGYSINDTVVIYDRIRENITKYKKQDMHSIINRSLNDTLSRTIMTSGTTLVACLALVLQGGAVIEGFSMSVLFGIIFGTYSSLYIAAPILIYYRCR